MFTSHWPNDLFTVKFGNMQNASRDRVKERTDIKQDNQWLERDLCSSPSLAHGDSTKLSLSMSLVGTGRRDRTRV